MNKEKKQVMTIWILTVLIVILIAIIAGLIVMVMKSKRDANITVTQQLAQTPKEAKQVTETEMLTPTSKPSQTSINNEVFYQCSDLTSCTFEEGSQLTSIGERAFSDIKHHLGTVNLDNHHGVRYFINKTRCLSTYHLAAADRE